MATLDCEISQEGCEGPHWNQHGAVIQPHAQKAEVGQELEQAHCRQGTAGGQVLAGEAPDTIKGGQEIELGQQVVGPVVGAHRVQEASDNPGQEGGV